MAGSERAWFRLIKRYEKRLYNYALRMTGSPEDAMDILQDILISLYRNLPSYRGDGAFAAWMFRIASFRCTDYYRKKGRQFATTDDVDVMDENAVDVALNIDRNRGVVTMMSSLPSEPKQAIELKFFQHFTFDEIAGQLGISSNTAKSRVYAALKKMREQNTDLSLVKESP
ncbi:MAG: RNA polymerase sigma factor [Pseudomonadales bacterium]